jgi:hypothetical protein
MLALILMVMSLVVKLPNHQIEKFDHFDKLAKIQFFSQIGFQILKIVELVKSIEATGAILGSFPKLDTPSKDGIHNPSFSS